MKTQELSKFDFHHGQALLRVAGYYPTLADVISEAVQNAIDVEASTITIVINHKNRTLLVMDDGLGTSKTKFEEALTQVCRTIKDESKLGRFGMGLIAPLGKCARFTFTSTPKSDPRAYLRWTFETENINEQQRIQGIPIETVPELHFEREVRSKGGVPWRTQVKIINFTKDRILSRVSTTSLREGILERYSAAMRRYNTTVIIKITKANGETETEKFVTDKYEGQRLPTEYIRRDDAGQSKFQLYIAKKTAKGRRGKVVVGEAGRDFRISFRNFARHAMEFFSPDVVEGLNSGVFEGEILSEKAKLDPSRKHFQMNDALVGFCIAIESWFRKTGEKHLATIKEETQDLHYQRLGLRSMKVVEALLAQPEFGYLKDVVKSFTVGTIGRHHFQPPEKRVVGPQSTPSVSVYGEEGGGAQKKRKGGTKQPQPEVEHTGHTPLTVSGPKGRVRMVVKGSSPGLQFLYAEMEGSDKLWELDTTTGVLQYNTRHPLWAQCEVEEKVLMRFQEHIAITALTLETVPDEWKERHRRMVDDAMPSIAFWLLKGDELSGRKLPTAKKSRKEGSKDSRK